MRLISPENIEWSMMLKTSLQNIIDVISYFVIEWLVFAEKVTVQFDHHD